MQERWKDLPVAPKAHLAVTSKGHGVFKGAGWSPEDLANGENPRTKQGN